MQGMNASCMNGRVVVDGYSNTGQALQDLVRLSVIVDLGYTGDGKLREDDLCDCQVASGT